MKHKHKIKLPVWFVIVLMFLMSALVSAVVADVRIHMVIEDTSMYIQETGKYPDWFIEWLNTEYLLEDKNERQDS